MVLETLGDRSGMDPPMSKDMRGCLTSRLSCENPVLRRVPGARAGSRGAIDNAEWRRDK